MHRVPHSSTFDCTHEPAHPDHLVCIERSSTQLGAAHAYFFRRYHTHYNPRLPFWLHHLLVDIALITAIAVLSALITVGGIRLFFITPRVVILTIDPLTEPLVSGQTERFRVTYTNDSREYLVNARLVLTAEPGMTHVRIDDATAHSFHNAIYLGAIRPGHVGAVEFHGDLFNALGAENQLSAVLLYSNKKGEEFESLAHLPFTLTDSIIDLAIRAPSSSLAHQRYEGVITINSHRPLPFSTILVRIVSPSLQIESIDNQPLHQLAFDVTKLPLTIPFVGKFKAHSGEKVRFDVLVSAREDTSIFLQERLTHTVSIRPPEIELSCESLPRAFSSDRPTEFVLAWKNLSKRFLKQVSVGVQISGPLADRARVQGLHAFRDKKNSSLLWTQNSHPLFGELPAGSRDSFPISIQAKSQRPPLRLSADQDLRVHIQPFAAYETHDGIREKIASQICAVPVTSSLSLYPSVRYFTPEGDQIGRGPLPPRVGRTTTYLVSLQFENGIHPIRDGVVAARLGPRARWTGRHFSHSRNITYRADTHELTWSIGDIPSQLGHDAATPAAPMLELSFTPSEDDLGKSGLLIHRISLSGVDVVTDTPVTAYRGEITTLLKGDTRSPGTDTVRL